MIFLDELWYSPCVDSTIVYELLYEDDPVQRANAQLNELTRNLALSILRFDIIRRLQFGPDEHLLYYSVGRDDNPEQHKHLKEIQQLRTVGDVARMLFTTCTFNKGMRRM